ncbi:MAG: ABC transporter substrate-binding protein [Chloroflexaceae bacterium]|nr:ABC transporter substrate-binding protein [Chloroflexaceae bacterium]
MLTKKRPVFLTLLLTLMALLAACGAPATSTAPTAPADPAAGGATAAPSGQTVTLRTGVVPQNIIYAPVYVGIARGYFQQEGITLELTPLQSGNEAVVQLAAGQFDVAIGGANAGLFNAAARGVKFTIVAPLHSERQPVASPLVISPKRAGEITSIADLKGKKVAVNGMGAGTEYWMSQALAQGGLTMQDVELTALRFPDMPAALESGAIDAAILTEPLTTISKDRGLVQVLADDFINGFTATYVYMGEPLLNGQPEVAQAFMRAYMRAVRDLQGDYMTDEVAAILEKDTGVPAAVLKRINKPQFDPSGRVPVENLQAMQAYFRERGLLEFPTDLDINTFVNTKLAEEAVAALR